MPGRMKYSVTCALQTDPNTPILLGGVFSKNVRQAREIGYDAVELHTKDPSLENSGDIVRLCEKYGLAVSAIGTGKSYVIDGLSLISSSNSNRESAVARLREYIDLASATGSYVIVGCIRGNIPDLSKAEIYERRLADSLKITLDYAVKKNVCVVLEAINRYENNYLNTAAEIVEFIQKYDLPMLRVMLDTFHMNIEEPDMLQAIHESRELLGYVHFADSNRLYPGAGHIDFKSILKTLQIVNYRGYVGMEYYPRPDGAASAEKGLQYIKTLKEITAY